MIGDKPAIILDRPGGVTIRIRRELRNEQPTLLSIAGTRPELIKLAPVIRQLSREEGSLASRTCFSGQHVEILSQVLGDLDVTPDVDLRTTSKHRTLTQGLAWLLERMDSAVNKIQPDGIIVQGDTNTALAGAMVALHHQLPCFHVEAGLRTADPMSPFPEEMNRRLISRIAALHFAPTEVARTNLLAEGVDEDNISITGNTGIDALRLYAGQPNDEANAILDKLTPGSRRLLVTLHRRENATRVDEVITAVRRLAMTNSNLEVMWILHHNFIRHAVVDQLGSVPGVHLIEPLGYQAFVHLMKAAYVILTDSGGVQEEAPVLNKPVLVLRDETERQEAVDAGCAVMVGCNTHRITSTCHRLLNDEAAYRAMAEAPSPFGDGHASERICESLERHYYELSGSFALSR